MDAARFLNTLWGAWLLSWLVAAAWTNRTSFRQPFLERLRYNVFISAGAIFLFGLGGDARPFVHPLYPRTSALVWCGVSVTIVGLAWTWWARLHIGRLWSARITLKEGHSLVRTGPYRLTRHPIYTGLLVALLATALATGTWAAFAGFVLCGLGLVLKSRQEERLLSATFGPQYQAYRAEVPALIPRPW